MIKKNYKKIILLSAAAIINYIRKEHNMQSRKDTRFEKARLIGSRALQISMGAKPVVDFEPDEDSIKIAIREYEEGVLPLDAIVLEDN